jgi:hypothetical protein
MDVHIVICKMEYFHMRIQLEASVYHVLFRMLLAQKILEKQFSVRWNSRECSSSPNGAVASRHSFVQHSLRVPFGKLIVRRVAFPFISPEQ